MSSVALAWEDGKGQGCCMGVVILNETMNVYNDTKSIQHTRTVHRGVKVCAPWWPRAEWLFEHPGSDHLQRTAEARPRAQLLSVCWSLWSKAVCHRKSINDGLCFRPLLVFVYDLRARASARHYAFAILP